MRPSSGDPGEMSNMDPPRLFRAGADIHRDAPGTQPFVTLPGNFGIGIFQGGNHAGDAGARDAIRARRRLALMRARLERHIHGGPLGRLFCVAQSLDLGMRTAALLRPATTDNGAILYNDRTDCGIRPGTAKIASAEGQREPHETLVVRSRVRNGCSVVHLRALAAGRPSSSPDNSSSAAR